MAKMVLVQVGEYRLSGWFDCGGFDLKRGDLVIVDLDRSSEFGRVTVANTSRDSEGRGPSLQGRVLRKVTDGDLRQVEHNRSKARDAFNVCISKISELKLDMKMLTAEYAFDSTKVIFYFTAEGRVDFRELVKELARMFRVRIELKQIGVRDRARMIKGYGVCGLPLCCSTFIKDFSQLSIKMAKEQALPLNPSKISGVCGRIKCCMAYEYSVYKELNKGLPKMGAKIQVGEGRGRVINLDVLKRVVHLDTGEGRVIKVTIPVDGDSKEILQQLIQAEPRAQARPSSEGRGHGRPEPRPDNRPAARNDARPEPRPESRPEARPDTHPSARPAPQAENKPGDRQRQGLPPRLPERKTGGGNSNRGGSFHQDRDRKTPRPDDSRRRER